MDIKIYIIFCTVKYFCSPFVLYISGLKQELYCICVTTSDWLKSWHMALALFMSRRNLSFCAFSICRNYCFDSGNHNLKYCFIPSAENLYNIKRMLLCYRFSVLTLLHNDISLNNPQCVKKNEGVRHLPAMSTGSSQVGAALFPF